jgi:RNA polymerase sigma-70 factor (ECF subfamily)
LPAGGYARRVARPRQAQEELGRVYRTHVDAVYAFLAASVRRAVAEDLTASTFERVVRAWGSYDPGRASERTWILSIARNLLTDHYRRQHHRAALSTDEHPELLEQEGSGRPNLEQVLSDDALRSWLAPLSDREREVVVLRYVLELSGTEVAAITGLSSPNIHQIASRALRRLRASAEAGRLRGTA